MELDIKDTLKNPFLIKEATFISEELITLMEQFRN